MSRFVATEKGLFRVDEGGRKVKMGKKEMTAMRDDLDMALAHYRPLVDETKKDMEAAQRDVDSADNWRRASMLGTVLGLGCSVYSVATEQATHVQNTIWNIRRDPPVINPTQLRPAFRSAAAIRAANLPFLCCAFMTLCIVRTYPAASVGCAAAAERAQALETTYQQYEGEKDHLVGMLTNLEKMLESPAYR